MPTCCVGTMNSSVVNFGAFCAPAWTAPKHSSAAVDRVRMLRRFIALSIDCLKGLPPSARPTYPQGTYRRAADVLSLMAGATAEIQPYWQSRQHDIVTLQIGGRPTRVLMER